ncbi:hypothetical protein [Alkalibaculum bacchi]|jgi:hypothetical protein|uniref:hypothetical protein n=1 Tax=Alkalibaculum bacchi TaxID=645887 RepID=UPI0026EA079F|nr:hypothetical protein [Alkalibaculum bacchi]
MESLIKKRILKILKILLLSILSIVLFFCIVIDILKFAITEKVPPDISYTEIIDERIDGSLKLYDDNRNNRYWLVFNKENKSKLILFTGDMRAYVYVTPVGKNEIEIYYDYLDDLVYPREDESFILDLSKNDTHNISFIRRVIQSVF